MVQLDLPVQSELVLWVNGTQVVEINPSPTETLISFLRRRLGLSGTKLGCAEGCVHLLLDKCSSFVFNSQKSPGITVAAVPVQSLSLISTTRPALYATARL